MKNVAHVVVTTFCKQRQRNEQEIITNAYTAIELVVVGVNVCLIKVLNAE